MTDDRPLREIHAFAVYRGRGVYPAWEQLDEKSREYYRENSDVGIAVMFDWLWAEADKPYPASRNVRVFLQAARTAAEKDKP